MVAKMIAVGAVALLIFVIVCMMLVMRSKGKKYPEVLDKIIESLYDEIKENIIDIANNIDVSKYMNLPENEALAAIESTIMEEAISATVQKVFKKIDSMDMDSVDKIEITKITDALAVTSSVIELFNAEEVQDVIAKLFNSRLTPKIEEIEAEDKKLEEEYNVYDNAEEKEECVESYNESIEEYINSPATEDIVKNGTIVVPVDDPRLLQPFVTETNIIPPVDEESDIMVDDGTMEIVEDVINLEKELEE